ncbi:MAG: exodeoxyribonuclease V subunit gamma, partial [Gammaproteobacteria bacterium]
MFILHTSNKTENLLAHLSKLLETSPPDSPFSKEIFLIQSQGMERWLSQQLASRFGVWGNYRFLFPGKFFSSMARRAGAGTGNEDFERERLLWRIEGLLRRLDGAEFAPLRDYLTGESSGLKRFQLARQLAQLFDQYQIMRPEMLAAWQRGEAAAGHPAENWQMSLWRMITGCLGESHRGSLWLEAIGRLDSSPEGGFADELPERLLIFGLNTLPPLFLRFLHSLARHMQVHLFLLNPCRTYWADLESKRQRARRNPAQEGNPEDVYEIGHPLLAVLGQQGREFQEMLLEGESFEVESFEDEYGPDLTNLQQLQSDILNNRMEAKKLAIDGTLSVHACHSRMREVEVVKDQLLDILEQEPNLSLRDMVVMAPDIQVYAPFISAVFADIQHAIADRSLRASSGRLDVFIRFLRLSQSRLGWQTVLELLEQPSVYPG